MAQSDTPSVPRPFIRIRDARVEFPSASDPTQSIVALRDVSLDLAEGAVAHLCGPNGSGKSTLLKLLTGEVEPVAGDIELDGKTVPALGLPRRCSVAMVSQHPEDGLVPMVSVRDHLAFRLYWAAKKVPVSFGRARQTAADYLHERPFLAPLAARQNDCALDLSGGWRQVLLVAAAVMCKPDMLLLDEPVSNLSDELRALVEDLLIAEVQARAVIYVSHLPPRPALAERLTTRWDINDGCLSVSYN